MNQQQINKLVELKDKGYQIKISSHYIDSFVHSIYEDEVEDGSVQWVYDSEVYQGAALKSVSASRVKVYQRIHNWEVQELDHALLHE